MTDKTMHTYDYWVKDPQTYGLHIAVKFERNDRYGIYGLWDECLTEDALAKKVYESILDIVRYPKYDDNNCPSLVIHPEDKECEKFALGVFDMLEQPLEDALKCIIDKYPELCV